MSSFPLDSSRLSSSSRSRAPLFVAGIVAAASLAGCAAQADRSDGPATLQPKASGDLAAEFPASRRGDPVRLYGNDLEGRKVTVVPGKGRPTVINIWGSWCSPCRAEAPILREASAEYAGRVDFVGINVRDNLAAAQAFEERFGIRYPSLYDSDGRAVLALNGYVPANAIPATLVLDRRGRVAARVLGEIRAATLRALLTPVLNERDGP